VSQQEVDFSNGNQVTIPLSNLKKGVYFLDLEKEGVSIQKLIIKQ